MKKRMLLPILLLLLMIPVLASCANSNIASQSAIATVDKNGKEITITVKPAESLIEPYRGKPLYLFALMPGESENSIGTRAPVASATSGETVTYKLPLFDKGVSRLYYSFTAAYYDEAAGQFVKAIKSAVFISNPEVLSKNNQAFPTVLSIKGLRSEHDADAVSLGIDHAVIDIPIEEYLLGHGSSEALSFIYAGKSYYLNRDAVMQLDERVSYFTDNGICVYFRFLLKKSPDGVAEDISYLYCPGAAKNALNYPLNMTDTRCAAAVAGFSDYFAERYTRSDREYGRVVGFIAGAALNSPGIGIGSISRESSMYGSELLVRTLYTAMASHYAAGRVYVTIDRNWRNVTAGGPADREGFFFLNEFAENAKNAGDYPWGVAASIKASSAEADRIWYDNSGNGNYLTPSSLENLTGPGFLSAASMLYNNEVRHAIIGGLSIETTASAVTESLQAASYAFAYYRTYQAGNLDAMIYSDQLDTPTSKSGLRAVGEEGKPGAERRIYHMMRDIDTDVDINAFVTEYNKDNQWTQLYASHRADVQRKYFRTGSVVVGIDPNAYKSSNTYDFSDGSLHGFEAVGSGSYIGLARVEDRSMLSAYLPGNSSVERTYLKKQGISDRELNQNSFIASIALDPEPGKPAESYSVILTLIKKDGRGDVVYRSTAENVAPGTPVDLMFDVKPFRDAAKKGEYELRLTATGNNGAGCIIKLYSLRSGKSGSNTLLIVILIVLAVLVLAGIIAGVFIWLRRNGMSVSDVFKGKKKRNVRRNGHNVQRRPRT